MLPDPGRGMAPISSMLLSITSTFPLSQFKDSQQPVNIYFLLTYDEIYLFALGSSLKLK